MLLHSLSCDAARTHDKRGANVRFGQCFIRGNLADHFHVISIRMESNTL